MPRLRTILRSLASHPVWGAVAFSCLSLIVLWAMVPQVAHAGSAIENALIQVVGTIIGFFVSILGTILIKFIGILVTVAQFNNFIDAPAVKIGWSVTRDISNMFFIVALLLIAVGTMFRIDQYRYSRTLQKLIMMAILINFSKAIAGFFIDFSQVVMLTFVNAFKDQAAGSLSAGFGIDKLLALSNDANAAGGDIQGLSVVGSLFAALIMVFVATVVVGIFTILLIQRIIMLWIYIVLAPTAYMVAVLPGSLGSWWGSWWRDFSQYLIKGPVIAFFLWLALTIITLSTNTLIPTSSTIEPNLDQPAFVNEATTGTNIINYLVAIGMLIAGLQQAAKSSGAAGAVAGKWMGNFNKWGSAIATSPISAAKGVGGAAMYAPTKLAQELGGGMVKRVAYPMADALMAVGSKIPLMKGYWGMQRGKFRNYRDTKDRTALERTDFNSLMAMQGVMPTEAGRANRAEAASVILTKQGKKYAKLSMDDKQKVWKNFASNAGFGINYDSKTGKIAEEYESARGRGIFNDAVSKNPALWSVMLNQLDEQKRKDPKMSRDEYDAKRAWMLKKAHQQANKMTTTGLNEMSTDFLTAEPGAEGSATRARFNEDLDVRKAFTEEMADRLINNTNFRRNYNANVVKDQQEDIWKSYQHLRDTNNWGLKEEFPAPSAGATKTVSGEEDLDAETLAQEDIDRKRQERTAARVAAYQQRNLNFHESDEYLKNKDQFYDLQSFNVNTTQEARRVERENLKQHGVALPVTGASTFANGTDNTLGVSEEVLNDAGVRLSAAGTVTNPEDKRKLADALSQKLTSDIADVERQLTSAPQEILDSVQEGSGTGTTVREALQMKVKNLQGTQERLKDTDQIGSLKFINVDRYGGNVRTAQAEEDFHEKIEEMDADRSFRNDLWSTMAPAQQQKIVQQMRDKTKRQDMSEAEAFDEYLAKGLTNLTRETWTDTSDDAVKLGDGLALQLQRQAEAKGVKMHKLDLLQPKANVQVPGRFDTIGAGTRAAVRGVTQKVTGAASKVASGVSGAVSTAAAATVGAAVSGAKKVSDVSTAPLRAGQRFMGKRAAGAAEEQRAEIPTGQLGVRVTREGLQDKRKELASFERQTQQETDDLTRQYQEQKQVMDTATSPLVAKRSAEKMKELRKTLKEKEKILKTKRDGVTDYEVMLKNSEESLGKNVGGAFRKGEKADQYMAAGQGQEPKSAAPKATVPPTPPAPSAPAPKPAATTAAPKPAPAAPTSAAAGAAPSAPYTETAPTEANAPSPEAAPNVNTHITNNITQVVNSMATPNRDNMLKLTGKNLDEAFLNSVNMRVLKGMMESTLKELQSSKKLTEISNTELIKRFKDAQKDADAGTPEAKESFTKNFKKIQDLLRGSGGEASV